MLLVVSRCLQHESCWPHNTQTLLLLLRQAGWICALKSCVLPLVFLQVPDISVADAQKNLKKSLEKGILKILSKMGISLLSCYHGAQVRSC